MRPPCSVAGEHNHPIPSYTECCRCGEPLCHWCTVHIHDCAHHGTGTHRKDPHYLKARDGDET